MSTQQRDWRIAVSERAYAGVLSQAARFLEDVRAKKRSVCNPAINVNVFADLDLGRIGTHSLKKTVVSLLAQDGVSMKIISAITATSESTLRRHYDTATDSRRRKALRIAFAPVLQGLSDDLPSGSASGSADCPGLTRPNVAKSNHDKYCTSCGVNVLPSWRFCYECGQELPAR